MSTELKSYTIVPDSLYVERKADKQLHDIIESMQRPGYVLVSRQMGKTNLLLRAKRKWENADDLYVYIDMSNIDEKERECFESLIDIAIDTHEDVLSCVRERIMDLRRVNITKSAVQAHNEELRAVLSAVKGKLVFILDEIDSLTRTSFSDNVFSQIRSVYFSRVNYPVLEKLTYVLSGVVEPTEIIKNPKISPFNIGEKILLDDFSREEYLSFLTKAGLLGFGETVIDRIYYWAGGNPRITWDICYELQHKTGVTADTVDTLVIEMYLTSFDKAPVDTIRNLVKEDRDLRDAIVQLNYDKGDALSDKIKSKLYLSGIINYSTNEVTIKNRIIKESLSLNWLKKVQEEEMGQLSYAISLLRQSRYQESVDTFMRYLEKNDFPEIEAPYYYYYLGTGYYHIKEFEKSFDCMTKYPLASKDLSLEYRHENLLLGADCLNLLHNEEAVAYFEKAMEGSAQDWVYYSAKYNILTAKIKLAGNDTERLAEIEQGYRDLLTNQDEAINNDIKLYAAFHLAGLYGSSKPQEACSAYDIALTFANEPVKLRILVEKYPLVSNDQRLPLIDEIIKVLSGITSFNGFLDPDKHLELDEDLFIRVFCLLYSNAYDRWSEVKDKIGLLPYSYGDFLYRMFLNAVYSMQLYGNSISRLIKELHDNIDSEQYQLSPNLHLPIYKFNAIFNRSDENTNEYLRNLLQSTESIDGNGLFLVRTYALTLFERKEYKSITSKLGWIVDHYPDALPHGDMVTRAVFEYILLWSYYSLNDRKSAMGIGNLILSYIDDEIKKSDNQDKETLERVKGSAQSVLLQVTSRTPVHSSKTHGRNEWVKVRYIDKNLVVKKKFKQVESDLQNSRCIIVEE